MTLPSAFRPGACAIGRVARRERGQVSLLSFAGAVGYAAFVLASDSPTVLLLGLFVPLSLGVEWGLQARRAFCVTPALRGRDDFRAPATDGGRGAVSDGGARAADRRGALRLTLVGVAAGAALTLAVYGVAVALGL